MVPGDPAHRLAQAITAPSPESRPCDQPPGYDRDHQRRDAGPAADAVPAGHAEDDGEVLADDVPGKAAAQALGGKPRPSESAEPQASEPDQHGGVRLAHAPGLTERTPARPRLGDGPDLISDRQPGVSGGRWEAPTQQSDPVCWFDPAGVEMAHNGRPPPVRPPGSSETPAATRTESLIDAELVQHRHHQAW